MFFKQALSLPAPEVSALTQGRMIVILPSLFLGTGQSFFLYPAETSGGDISLEKIYRSSFLPDAKIALNQAQNNPVLIKSWAKCELCHRLYDHPELLEKLAQLTIWTGEGLRAKIEEKNLKNLAYLRVYKLPEPFEIQAIAESSAKIGKFLGLSISANVSESIPILDDITFAKRQSLIKNLEPPEHPELEELETAIAQLTLTYPDAKFLKDKIQTFLGWQPAKPDQIPENLKWIYTINQLGTTAEGGNYEKGTAFEKIVHQSLNFLGFELDQNAKGGAGGMDLYCTKPYLMVGECKAGKSLPDSTAEQLYRIGVRHLEIETYQKAVKLIIGPGKPTSYLEESAQKSTISIINPMTLEKLVKLQAQYPGSVNLFELKNYLQAGQMDAKIDEYIEIVINRLKLRSHIIQLFKKSNQPINLDNVIGAYSFSNPPQPLEREQLKEILIELSSPLTGYLGRTQDDRFYFLRELIVDQTESFDYNL
jgi:Uncharacterized protein conserved in bacteria